MTHPLIDFLKTPMAAPETARLRHMRRWWMGLCWGLALAVLLLPLSKALLGEWAPRLPHDDLPAQASREHAPSDRCHP